MAFLLIYRERALNKAMIKVFWWFDHFVWSYEVTVDLIDGYHHSQDDIFENPSWTYEVFEWITVSEATF